VALESIRGVNPAVTAFPGIDAYVQVLQRHGERVARVAGRFGQHPRGGTPMYEALWYVAAQLVLQREPRKLLIVLTDGDPSRPANVKRLVGELENRGGIEIYGVGIATMVVKSLFRSYRVINDVRELRTALFEIARAALLAA
jgi:Mg-chelatase subunit ChlD